MLPSLRALTFTALALALLVPPASAHAQAVAAPASCAAELDWATSWAARNYSGFEDKVGAAPARYDSLLAELRPRASAAATERECDVVLGAWVASFRDGHISVGRPRAMAARGAVQQSSAAPDEVRARFADWPRVDVDEAAVRAQLAAREPDAIEGIWQSADAGYRVAILRDSAPGAYVMSILRADSVWWTPGQVKARLTRDGDAYATRFYMRDHSEQAWRGAVTRNVLRFQSGSAWLREFPRREGDVSAEAYAAMTNSRFRVREIAPGTMLVQVPTFDDPRGMDSLMAAEGARLRAAERLVIDVRGNGGGSDFNFRELAKLLYTGPVRTVSNMALATDENNAANARLVADTTIPQSHRDAIGRTLAEVKAGGTRWYAFEDGVTTGEVLARPRHVAIIADRGCASSCEGFLFVAQQSAKTRIYGTNTAGIADYGNVRRADMPGGTLTLWHPTTKSKRVAAGQGIDGVGIPPHVRIPADVVDQIAWVAERLQREP